MNDRMIWLVRIIAIFIFLLLAYLLMSLHAKLRQMQTHAFLESRVAATSCSPGREPGDLAHIAQSASRVAATWFPPFIATGERFPQTSSPRPGSEANGERGRG
jgi:hypothetical protein